MCQACSAVNLPLYDLPSKAKIYVSCVFYLSSNPISICKAEAQCSAELYSMAEKTSVQDGKRPPLCSKGIRQISF